MIILAEKTFQNEAKPFFLRLTIDFYNLFGKLDKIRLHPTKVSP
jgi:hypothetical protein